MFRSLNQVILNQIYREGGWGGEGAGSWYELIETLLSSRRAGRFSFTLGEIVMNHNSVKRTRLRCAFATQMARG